MTLDQSSLLELLDALKAAEVDDRIRAAALARAAEPGTGEDRGAGDALELFTYDEGSSRPAVPPCTASPDRQP
jgi:hypothetical protein